LFTTCIFCHSDLGRNEIVEEFPVGRRLAFDATRGRLWVVCRKCERWNLSPLDARWEAIEACERLYRDTRLRVATDNIGLARLSEGLELVRIGEPLRPEFAAWRYGDQFGRRRRRAILFAGGAVVAVGGLAIAGAAAGIGMGAFGGIWGQIPNMINGMRVVKVRTPDGRNLKVRGTTLPNVRLTRDAHDEPLLSFKHGKQLEMFRGADALTVAGRLVPAINPGGGGRKAVAEAVAAIESRRGSEAFIDSYLATMAKSEDKKTAISRADRPTRLALEMALHEEAERRAIEGELATLEAAWVEAEEIAHIADNLFVSADVNDRLERLKSGVREPEE
jgi:hypothetical protein